MEIPLLVGITQSVASAYKLLYSSDSDSENEVEMESFKRLVASRICKRRRNCVVPVRMRLFVEVTIPQYSAKEFRADFRLPKRTYERLLELLTLC